MHQVAKVRKSGVTPRDQTIQTRDRKGNLHVHNVAVSAVVVRAHDFLPAIIVVAVGCAIRRVEATLRGKVKRVVFQVVF